ncbi:ABC transporter substrate-binding protein [Hyperthermus butylicus]|uniref:ABC-type branched-chain amino acid transport, periplasmic component n=1 Tax=Hyperthermus butylicus (strain DSM 5456 / JCM 9403 / PLM1-5) TaxID=415426 RepID=A2BKG3_HYPBU|nr:ABC transporter substrate-binding protein [Hyperthermus butylicus]ABM80474.1 ABC-type branched-chain amino acid transport, periplasmic component [Hyperthermus butylicus DSM 5456]
MKGFRAISIYVVVGLLILGLLVGLAVGYFIGGGGGESKSATSTPAFNESSSVNFTAAGGGLQGEIPIGILLPQTGSLAQDGRDNIKAAKLAIEDFNKLLESIGAPFRFKAIVADSGTDPNKALAALQTLYNQHHVQIVVGTDSSWVLSGVMSFANEHHIVMISPASTSPALALKDYIFRIVGNDKGQGKALAALVHNNGFNAAVVIFRDEAYGRGIAEAFKENFEALGGTAVLVPYNPQKSDYAPEVQKLASEVEKLLNEGKNVAVIIVAFETDGINILSHAADIPVLSQVKWFASESIRSPALLKAPDKVRQFLAKVELEGTFPIPPKSPLGEWFEKHFEEVYGHPPESPFSPYAYDAAYLACLAVTIAGKYDGTVIAKVLPEVAKNYYGVTGWKLLDENGDLKYQEYSIWKYVCEGGSCEFIDIAIYDPQSGKIQQIAG